MPTGFRRLRLMTFLLSLAFGVCPTLAFADHSWGSYHWARSSNPFTVKLGDNLSNTWDPYLSAASSDWSQSTVLNTTIVAGGTAPKKCRASAGRVEVCATTYGNNGWLGVAQIWISGSHITRGTVKLNDTYFNTAKYNTSEWRNLVMCQEVGHTLGLDHQDENFNNTNLNTCMDYTNDPSTNQHPNQHDYEQLIAIYGHDDSTTTAFQSVQNGRGQARARTTLPDPDSDEPAVLGTGQWGKLIRSTNHGRTELYELDLGRGHKILTHVIWAEPGEEPGSRDGRR